MCLKRVWTGSAYDPGKCGSILRQQIGAAHQRKATFMVKERQEKGPSTHHCQDFPSCGENFTCHRSMLVRLFILPAATCPTAAAVVAMAQPGMASIAPLRVKSPTARNLLPMSFTKCLALRHVSLCPSHTPVVCGRATSCTTAKAWSRCRQPSGETSCGPSWTR